MVNGDFQELCSREDNKAVHQIKLDLPRTFSSHIHFREEEGQGYVACVMIIIIAEMIFVFFV